MSSKNNSKTTKKERGRTAGGMGAQGSYVSLYNCFGLLREIISLFTDLFPISLLALNLSSYFRLMKGSILSAVYEG